MKAGRKFFAISVAMVTVMGGMATARAADYFPRFTAIQDSEDVANYYNGGFGADDPTDCPSLPAGSSYCYGAASGGPGNSGPGPNWGISFSPGAQVVSDVPTVYDAANGLPASGTFANAPGGTKALVFVSAASAVMNVASGFTTGFAFYYAADDGQTLPSVAGTISVWSGLNATGTELAELTLNNTADDGFLYDVWAPDGVSFAGSAYSIDFAGAENDILFQVVSIGTTTPNLSITSDPIPEPASLGLLGAAAAALSVARRRRR